MSATDAVENAKSPAKDVKDAIESFAENCNDLKAMHVNNDESVHNCDKTDDAFTGVVVEGIESEVSKEEPRVASVADETRDGVIRMCRLKTLPGQKPYECQFESCGKRFDTKILVYRHIRAFHKKQIVFVNENGEELDRFANDKQPRSYPCNYPGCGCVFTRSNHILRHRIRAHPDFKPEIPVNNDKNDSCEHNESFMIVSALDTHEQDDTKPTASTPVGQTEGMHLRSSTSKVLFSPPAIEPVKPFSCNDCGQKFFKNDQLKKHLEKSHSMQFDVPATDETVGSQEKSEVKKKSRRPFVCDQENCTKSYTKYGLLLKHKVQCHDFERKSKSRSENVNGTSVHTPPPKDPIERPYVCTQENCDWSFKRSYHLDRHMESHQRKAKTAKANDNSNNESNVAIVKQDSPPETSKKNEWQSRLRQNKPVTIKYVETIALAVEKEKIKEPEPEKPFHCDFPGCGKKFKKTSHLDVHYNVHSGPSGDQLKRTPPKKRPYEENDEARFEEDGYEGEGEENFDSNDMSRHKRRKKKKEKGAYSCDVEGCEKKFSRNCELTRHKLNHVDVWPFTCEQPGCGRKFKRKDIYRNHQKTHNKPLDTEGKPKPKPRKKPKPLPVEQPTCTELWNATPTWPETSINPSSVSISIINVTLPSQTPSVPTLQHSTATSHSYTQSVPHQMQTWTQPQQGRPTVVQQAWGHPINVNLAPATTPPNWPAVVTRPSVVQATWSNAVRPPESQNQVVPNPSVLETLGLRPSGLTTQWITIPNSEHEPTLPQCRYTTNDQVHGQVDQREGWTL